MPKEFSGAYITFTGQVEYFTAGFFSGHRQRNAAHQIINIDWAEKPLATLAATLENSQGLVKKIKDGVDENQWSMLFLIRLIPGVPFFLANLVPSFLDVPLRRFVISTFLGIFPGALVFTSIGAGLGDIFERGQTPDLSIVWEPQIILPILGLCLLSALPIVLKVLRGKKGI